MPKLNKANAAAAQEKYEEGGSFAPLDPGTYTGRLAEVEAKESSTGKPMWVWIFDELQTLDGDKVSGRQWVNTVIQDNAMWKVGEMFAAFGVDTTTDTDLLIGKRCKLQIEQRVIQGGARQGELGNNVRRCLPLEGTPVAAGVASGGGSKAATAGGDSTLEF